MGFIVHFVDFIAGKIFGKFLGIFLKKFSLVEFLKNLCEYIFGKSYSPYNNLSKILIIYLILCKFNPAINMGCQHIFLKEMFLLT